MLALGKRQSRISDSDEFLTPPCLIYAKSVHILLSESDSPLHAHGNIVTSQLCGSVLL